MTIPHEVERRAIAETGRRLEAEGLLAITAGNLSTRLGPNLIAISPSAIPYARTEAEDVVVTDLDGTVVDGDRRPSSEIPFHTAVYRARPDVGGVVHTHSPFATVLAIMRRPIPAVHYVIASFGVDEIPVVQYETYGTTDLAEKIAEIAASGANGALLANHGAVAFGVTLDKAAEHASLLEFLATAYYRALVAGAPTLLPTDELDRVRRRFEIHGQPGP